MKKSIILALFITVAVIGWFYSGYYFNNNKGKKIVRGGIAIRRGQVGNLDVYALRRDGFDGEIELKVEGFPQSFKVKTTKLEKGKNHCSLSFYNAEDAPPWV